MCATVDQEEHEKMKMVESVGTAGRIEGAENVEGVVSSGRRASNI